MEEKRQNIVVVWLRNGEETRLMPLPDGVELSAGEYVVIDYRDGIPCLAQCACASCRIAGDGLRIAKLLDGHAYNAPALQGLIVTPTGERMPVKEG